MSERDREETLAKYNELFDKAWNEEELLEQLGSPTRAAISELRGYVPSAEPEVETQAQSVPPEPAEPKEPAPEPPAAAPAEPPLAQVPEQQAAPEGLIEPEPTPESLPDESPTAEGAPEAETQAAPAEPAQVAEYFRDTTKPEPAPEELPPALAEIFDEAALDANSDGDKPSARGKARADKPRMLGGRFTLYLLFGVLLCVPATDLLILIALAFLGAGALLIYGGIFTFTLGFAGITVFADMMLLFGAGLVIAALGVPIAVFAIWFFMKAVVGFVNLILRTGRNWCYEPTKEVPEE